jgi:hypothetical protein
MDDLTARLADLFRRYMIDFHRIGPMSDAELEEATEPFRREVDTLIAAERLSAHAQRRSDRDRPDRSLRVVGGVRAVGRARALSRRSHARSIQVRVRLVAFARATRAGGVRRGK